MRTFAVVFLAFLILSCGKKEVSFQNDVQPILNTHCMQCHGIDKAAGLVLLTSYEGVMNSKVTKWKKPIVVPGNLSESWLYLQTSTNQPHFRMPPDTLSMIPLNDKEIEIIAKWIQQGAKNN